MIDERSSHHSGVGFGYRRHSHRLSMVGGCAGDTCAFSLLPGELMDGYDDEDQRGNANQNQQ